MKSRFVVLLLLGVLAGCASQESQRRATANNISRMLAIASEGRLEQAADFASRAAALQPTGEYWHAYFLTSAAVYHAGSGAHRAAARAIAECASSAKVDSRRAFCEKVMAQYASGIYPTREAVVRFASEALRARTDRMAAHLQLQEELEKERASYRPTVAPSIGMVLPGAGLGQPGVAKPRTSPNKNWCVPVTVTRDSDGYPIWWFRNNCPTEVKIGWCDLNSSGACLDIGTMGAAVRPGATYRYKSLSKLAVGPRHIACSGTATGYNVNTRDSNWYCGPER